jgi:hypothetical protein
LAQAAAATSRHDDDPSLGQLIDSGGIESRFTISDFHTPTCETTRQMTGF